MIYKARSDLTEDWFIEVSLEEVREKLKIDLEEFEDWIYLTKNATLKDFDSKLEKLRKDLEPIVSRAFELQNRDAAVKMARGQIQNLYNHIVYLLEKMPWVKPNQT